MSKLQFMGALLALTFFMAFIGGVLWGHLNNHPKSFGALMQEVEQLNLEEKSQ